MITIAQIDNLKAQIAGRAKAPLLMDLCRELKPTFDEGETYCPPCIAALHLESLRDRGASPSDTWEHCEECGVTLAVTPTEALAKSEIEHLTTYPPTIPTEWWRLSMALEALTHASPLWPTVAKLVSAWTTKEDAT